MQSDMQLTIPAQHGSWPAPPPDMTVTFEGECVLEYTTLLGASKTRWLFRATRLSSPSTTTPSVEWKKCLVLIVIQNGEKLLRRRERKGSKNKQLLNFGGFVRHSDRLLSRLCPPGPAYGGLLGIPAVFCHCHSPPLTPRKRRPAYLHCLLPAGISQIGSPRKRVEQHGVSVTSEMWSSVADALYV